MIIARIRSESCRALKSNSVCFGVERAHSLLEQEMNHHLQAGQRCLQLMADGRDHVALELVDQPELGHVGKHDRRSQGPLLLTADRQHARQEELLLTAVTKTESQIEVVRDIIRGSAEYLGEWPFELGWGAQGTGPSADGATPRIRHAAGLARSTAPVGSTTTTGSGIESIVA